MKQLDMFKDHFDNEELESDFALAHNRVYVSFSGGKDSIAALEVTLRQYPKHIVTAIFADTGDESPETYDYVRFIDKHIHPVIRIGSRATHIEGQRRRELETVLLDWSMPNDITHTANLISVYDEIRYRFEGNKAVPPFPANGIRFCTQTLKIRAFNRYVKATMLDSALTCVVIGLRRAESNNRSKTPHFSYNLDFGWDVWYPIYDYDLEDVWQAHDRLGVHVNPTYAYRERSNCTGCPFSNPSEVANSIRQHGVKAVQGWLDLERDTGYKWRADISMQDIATNPDKYTAYKPMQLMASCTDGVCDI